MIHSYGAVPSSFVTVLSNSGCASGRALQLDQLRGDLANVLGHFSLASGIHSTIVYRQSHSFLTTSEFFENDNWTPAESGALRSLLEFYNSCVNEGLMEPHRGWCWHYVNHNTGATLVWSIIFSQGFRGFSSVLPPLPISDVPSSLP